MSDNLLHTVIAEDGTKYTVSGADSPEAALEVVKAMRADEPASIATNWTDVILGAPDQIMNTWVIAAHDGDWVKLIIIGGAALYCGYLIIRFLTFLGMNFFPNDTARRSTERAARTARRE